MTQTVLVVQREFPGHRLGYVRVLLEALPADVRAVVLLVPGAAASAEYAHHLTDVLAAHPDRFEVREAPGETFLHGVLDAAEDTGAHRVVLLNADRELTQLVRLPRRRTARLGLRLVLDRTESRRPADALRLVGKRALVARIGRRWGSSSAWFLTDSFGAVVHRPFLGRTITGVVDPPLLEPVAHDRVAARVSLGLPVDVPLLAVVGDVSERKNAPLALAALSAERLRGVHLVLAGVPTPAVREVLAQLPDDVRSRVHHHDGYVSDEVLASAVKAADCLLILQDFDAPSGTIVLAARSGTPVVVGRSPWLRTLVRQHGLGGVADHDVESVAAAADAVLRAPRPAPLALPDPRGTMPMTGLVG